MARKRRRRKKRKVLTYEQKIQRQRQALIDLEAHYGPALRVLGYCADCLLPLLVPGTKVPLANTLEWDPESPHLNCKRPEYCIDCAPRAQEQWKAAVQAGIQVRGRYVLDPLPPDAPQAPADPGVDTEGGS